MQLALDSVDRLVELVEERGPVDVGAAARDIFRLRSAPEALARTLVTDLVDNRLLEVRRRMEIVRLGEGVDKNGHIDPAALERTLAALRQYAQEIEVLEAEQQLYPAEDALAQTQRDQFLAVVDLYKALGGGWNLSDRQWAALR